MTVHWKYATPRTPSRRSYGRAVAAIAASLGRPLMPWQRHVADVATELMPDGSWAYSTVGVSVQRQSGKTTLMAPVELHRALIRPMARIWHTAQSRQDARDWLVDEVAPLVRRSPLRSAIKVRESQGSEALRLRNGSSVRIFAPGEEALHGKANDLVELDEIWTLSEAEGHALVDGAILPTFTTKDAQLWWESTAGTKDKSAFMLGYVTDGRSHVSAGETRGVAYFECGLPDDDETRVAVAAGVGPVDEVPPDVRARALELVLEYHPAYPGTVRPTSIERAMTSPKMTPGEFLRAYGNLWTDVSESVIPAGDWSALAAAPDLDGWPQPGPGVPVALAFDVAIDEGSGAVLAVWDAPDRSGIVRRRWDVVVAQPGIRWMPDALAGLWRTGRFAVLAHDTVGPAVAVADALERRRIPLTGTKLPAYASACTDVLSRTRRAAARRAAGGEDATGLLMHHSQPELDEAVANAVQRNVGDRWVWGRRQSSTSIAPLVAGTIGSWALDHLPTPQQPPLIRVARA